jgi:hypothetical protein
MGTQEISLGVMSWTEVDEKIQKESDWSNKGLRTSFRQIQHDVRSEIHSIFVFPWTKNKENYGDKKVHVIGRWLRSFYVRK